jgi:polynucleotide kinase-phosphatase
MTKQILLPHSGIVLLVGPSNSGKTTLLNRLVDQGVLSKSEIVSSDQFRVLVADTEFIELGKRPKEEQDILYAQYQKISQKAFEAMDEIINVRCLLGKLTVVDATHLRPDDRKKYVALAEKNNVRASAIVLDLPEKVLLDRDELREFPRGKNRIKQQVRAFKSNLRSLRTEGFSFSYVLNETDLEHFSFGKLENPLLKEVGSGLDFIGDIHGCFDEFLELLNRLGYQRGEGGTYTHPDGRKLVSVGDVLGRGPYSLDCLLFFKLHVDKDIAYMIDSNHGWKIVRWLDGRNVELSHGDEKIPMEFEQFEKENGKEATEQLKEELKGFLLKAPSNIVFSQNGVGVIVAAHAGIRDEYIGKQSRRISDFCRYGDTDGCDESGKPVRKDWFVNHQSGELIVWGHDPKPQPMVVNNTINIDQGAVFGGKLTAFRYPEKAFVFVEAKADYSGDPENFLQKFKRERFNPPNIQSFLNGYSVLTDLYGEIKVQGEVVKSAIEEVSHYTIPIEELLYIPPTMSPAPEVSPLEDYLEHPREAFNYYRNQGITTMVMEKKHMGSRAILMLFKSPEVAVEYVGRKTLGTIYSRTGRPFFNEEVTNTVLGQLNVELNNSGYFETNNTDFVLLDAEILPWNLKAKELISSQYAHVAEVAIIDRSKLLEKLNEAKENGWAVDPWIEETVTKLKNAETFRQVFQNYCWDTDGTTGIQIAPFHILAHSNKTFFDKSHVWHMEQSKYLATLCRLVIETEFKVITDEKSEEDATRWWQEMTEQGHEGFVVKPETFIAKSDKEKLVQPAIKVRGRKYLHIIYGIDYLAPQNLVRLKQRNVGKKQRHALMEFALGIEGIQRFIQKEPVARVHECVLATLALEADPVDPRL